MCYINKLIYFVAVFLCCFLGVSKLEVHNLESHPQFVLILGA